MSNLCHEGLRTVQLEDVLLHLPLPLLRDSLWPHLSSTDQASFRVSSRCLLRMADQMQRKFSVNLRKLNARGEDTSLVLSTLGACMSRQEHLEVLEFEYQTDVQHVVDKLGVGGRAACRRVHDVRVYRSSSLSRAAGAALAQVCPALRTLHIEHAPDASGHFFVALGGLEHLAEVDIVNDFTDAYIVHSLRALGALRTLRLRGDDEAALAPAALPYLATLTGLRHLQVHDNGQNDPDAILHLGAAVLSLTRLTQLKLGTSWSYHNAHSDSRNAASEAACNAVLARLGALQGLVSLDIADLASRIDAAGFEGLRHLSRLTCLHVDGLCIPPSAACAAAGALPQLRELRLAQPLGAAELLDALRPLLPLRQLETLTADLCLGSSLSTRAQAAALAAADGNAAAAAAVGLTALSGAVEHLAAAPSLRHVRLTIVGDSAASGGMELGDCMAALQVLYPRLQRFHLRTFGAEQLGGLSAALACAAAVPTLCLVACTLGDATLLDLALHAHTLRALHLRRGSCQDVTHSGVLAFVSACVRPLAFSWSELGGADLATMQEALGPYSAVSLVPFDTDIQ